MSQVAIAEAMDCRDIQYALLREFDKSGAIICLNSQRVLAHEADVLVVRKSGVSIEIEVKVSRSDFAADFRKADKHAQLASGYEFGPQHFYFASEPHIIPLAKVPAYAGLIHVSPAPAHAHISQTCCVIVKEAPRLHRTPHEGIHERICRALMYKAIRNF